MMLCRALLKSLIVQCHFFFIFIPMYLSLGEGKIHTDMVHQTPSSTNSMMYNIWLKLLISLTNPKFQNPANAIDHVGTLITT